MNDLTKRLMCGATFLLVVVSIFYLVGCAPYVVRETIFDKPQKQDETLTFYVDITSEPNDAEIYFDNQLVGRTPAYHLPLIVPAYYTPSKPIVSSGYYELKGDHAIRISKQGYIDINKVLNFYHDSVGDSYKLAKSEYHFDLQPRTPSPAQQSAQSASPQFSGQVAQNNVSPYDFRISGIIGTDSGPAAIINGAVVKVGDKIGPYKVKEIRKHTVIITDGQSDFEID